MKYGLSQFSPNELYIKSSKIENGLFQFISSKL